MSLARLLSVIPSWTLALLLGLGPLGAEVLAALGHAQVCTCCRSGEAESCCGEEAEEPVTPRAVSADGACPCALAAPTGTGSPACVPRWNEARSEAHARLERFHRAVELAWVELPLPEAASESSPAPPGPPGPIAGPPGSSQTRGSERAAALGVLRL